MCGFGEGMYICIHMCIYLYVSIDINIRGLYACIYLIYKYNVRMCRFGEGMFRSWSSLTVSPEVLKNSLSLFTQKKDRSIKYNEKNEKHEKHEKHENEKSEFVDNVFGDGEMFVVALNARLPKSRMDVQMTGRGVL
jgi:hypothetical protein